MLSLANSFRIGSRTGMTGISKVTSSLVDRKKDSPFSLQKRHIFDSVFDPESIALLATCSGAATTGFMVHRYKIALSNQYVVKTGLFIDGASIHKKTFQFPFQTANFISMEPKPYHHVIDKAMSKEKIAFKMPVAFTIGPLDTPEALQNMVKSILGISVEKFDDLVLVAVAGACRRQAGTLELEHIFSDRTKFRDQVIDIINKELFPFGLHILTMNIDELEDMEGNVYFKYLRQRALEGAVNTAKVAVAEKQREGAIGEKLHQSETRKEVAELEKEAKLVENERDVQISKSDSTRDIAKAEYSRAINVAKLEAEAKAEMRKFELQKEVEEFRKVQEIERLRASKLSAANVDYEVVVKNADAKAAEKVKQAQAEAESIRLIAEANLLSKQTEAKGVQVYKEAEAKGIQAIKEAEAIGVQALKRAEAEGVRALRDAEADGLQRLVKSAGGVDELNKYLIIKEELLPKIASHNASAVRDSKPKISIWNTGPGDNKSGLSNVITDIVKTGVPLLDTLKAQTGIDVAGKFFKTESKSECKPKSNSDTDTK
jgi:flotillin